MFPVGQVFPSVISTLRQLARGRAGDGHERVVRRMRRMRQMLVLMVGRQGVRVRERSVRVVRAGGGVGGQRVVSEVRVIAVSIGWVVQR